MKGDPPISAIYGRAEVSASERAERAKMRENSLAELLWHKHGVAVIAIDDLDTGDVLGQHLVNICEQKFGKRRVA